VQDGQGVAADEIGSRRRRRRASAGTQQPGTARDLRILLSDRATLQRAFIFKELIEKPVAMRSDHLAGY